MTITLAISATKSLTRTRRRALEYAFIRVSRNFSSTFPLPKSDDTNVSELRKVPLIRLPQSPSPQSPTPSDVTSLPPSPETKSLHISQFLSQSHSAPSWSRTISDVMPPEKFVDIFEPDIPPHTIGMESFDYSSSVSGTFHVQHDVSGEDVPNPTEQRPIAKLAHGLDRVLFNPGVHWLRDPRSRVYNFSPWLQMVPKLSTFDFDRSGTFIKSSQDNDLFTAAQQHNCRFAGSTSSLSGMLSHIYFLLSRMQPVDLSSLSRAFESSEDGFTPGQRLPASVILNYKEGMYLIDADPGDPSEVGVNVLSFTGTMLEKFLTVSKAEFQTYLHDSPILPETDHRRDAYRYAKFGGFMMRSQLDCQDNRLPGTGIFDIKTRAALPLRMDQMNIEEASGYLLRSLQGRMDSFEREYYDLIRSAFLKYSFQARIGNMDGVMVTYHNTSQIFGFQYVPLEDMDMALYGRKDIGSIVFTACVRLLDTVMAEIVSHFPEQSVSCLWKTPDDGQSLQIFVEPTEWNAESEGDKPIVQLNVTVDNFLNGARYRELIIPELNGLSQWQIDYDIGTIDDDYDVIRARRQELIDVKRRFWALPSGMTVQQMEEFWKGGMGIGRAPEGEFQPDRFKEASQYLQYLRSRARSGAIETMRLRKEERGKKKVIWKQSDELEEWEQDVIDEGFELPEEMKDDEITSQVDGSQLPPPLRLMNDIQRPIMELLSTMDSTPSFTPSDYVVKSNYRARDAEEPIRSIFRRAESTIVHKQTSKNTDLKHLKGPLKGLSSTEAALLVPRLLSRVHSSHSSMVLPWVPSPGVRVQSMPHTKKTPQAASSSSP